MITRTELPAQRLSSDHPQTNSLRYGRLDALNHQRAILGSKSNAVAKGDSYVCFSRLISHVIEITLGIGRVQIDRRRNNSPMHRAQGRTQPCGTASALRASNL